MSLPVPFRRRPPAPPPDPLGLMSCRQMPSDIELARDRAVAQATAQRQALQARFVNLGILAVYADKVIEHVQEAVTDTASRMPYERERVDGVAKTTAILINQWLNELGQ